MFGHKAIHLSPWAGTQQTLTFYRNLPGVRAGTGEELSNYKPVLTLDNVDVQPFPNRSVLNNRLAQVYAQMYLITIQGDAPLQTGDRCFIDGAECVIEGHPHRWGGHTECEVGAFEPGSQGNVLANQQTEA